MTNPQSETHNSKLPRVLIIHNRYRQPGGEDVCVQAQAKLLAARGHEVRVFEKENREIDSYGFFRKVGLYFKTAENPAAALEVAKAAQEFQPHVALIHNTLPLLSPSIYAPLQKAGTKIIQYLHNYRLVCPAGTLFRDGAPCTLCVDDTLQHAAKYNCWTGSKMATLALTRMLDRHRRARTWHTKVDLFVALNSYMRDVFLKKGVVPAGKIVVQPNFVEVPQIVGSNSDAEFVFVARMTQEKGLATLLGAQLKKPELRIKLIGDGPMRIKEANGVISYNLQGPPNEVFVDESGKIITSGPGLPQNHIQDLGRLSRDETLRHIASSRALVFTSLWPEGCPAVIQEAFALGKPVIASRVAGAMELVKDGETGLLFDPGNADQLAACMKKLQDDPALAAKLGANARAAYEKEYSPDAGYRRMTENFSRLGI